jgi:hypothetical protein
VGDRIMAGGAGDVAVATQDLVEHERAAQGHQRRILHRRWIDGGDVSGRQKLVQHGIHGVRRRGTVTAARGGEEQDRQRSTPG